MVFREPMAFVPVRITHVVMGNVAIKNRTEPNDKTDGAAAILRTVVPIYDVSVLGLGYVGLPTAAILAARGLSVAGIDIQSHIVATINQGDVHLIEPDLAPLVQAGGRSGRLRAYTWPVQAHTHIISVPTPLTSDHEPDLSYVEAAVISLLPVLHPGNLVILESTVPPGTTRDHVAKRLEQAGFVLGETIFVAHAPERVLPGAIVKEVVENPRVVGGVTRACTARAAEFYASLIDAPIHRTDAETAELTKLAENSYRDVNIAFANELANVCQHLGANVWDVIHMANHHPRVSILNPGPGVGGHCIAVDPWFLTTAARHETPLIQCARRVNDGRIARTVARVRDVARHFARPRIACLGLTYKADIDDLRNAPGLLITTLIHREGLGHVVAVDPHLQHSPLPEVELVTAAEALEQAEIIVILVAHRSFIELPKHLFDTKAVIDTVGLLQSP